MWLRRIDNKIVAARQREAEQEHGRQRRPSVPDWIVELGIGAGDPLPPRSTSVTATPHKRRRLSDRNEARRLLTSGLPVCPHCRPDQRLGILE